MSGCIALIVAAGRGRRFGGGIPKQYRTLAGVAVLRRTLAAFAAHPEVAGVRAVIHPDDRALYDAAAHGLDVLPPVVGGETRQDSVRLGLESLAGLAPDTVLIHDGARPFADAPLISRVIAALAGHPGALPALAVVDTVKRGNGGLVAETIDRGGLFLAQTPQGFRFGAIRAAHAAQAGQELTDDAAVAEAAGLTVALVAGSEANRKITTEEDLMAAEMAMTSGETRIGSGFDVHRFVAGTAVTLCGVAIPHSAALEGHSDADVALHALTDALLGAAGAGDIGQHFPPSDPQWRGAASRVFVTHAAGVIAAAGGTIVNVDVTVICEAPRVGPHRDAMRTAIADMLGIAPERVNVKGTTSEGLGFTGRREGIAAMASASVRYPLVPR